ncbi:hypothetical protein ACIQGZ_19030 [Streptomyces sp. NPDC092296]|uniref:hypothetical protein n=1 Tax=Streptomyces sp. NPDC092296 TaxID=3366012 RepID=UPI0038240BA4
MDTVEKIVRTCLYEGYLLWPYRRSTLKNRQRWTFGGVYPRSCADALGEDAVMRTQVLLEADPGTDPGTDRRADRRADPWAGLDLAVSVRFLHLVDRTVLRPGPHGLEPVDSLTVDGRRHVSWQEATERRTDLPPTTAAALLAGHRTTPLDLPGGTDREQLTDRDGRPAGVLERSWQPLTGTVTTTAERIGDTTLRLTVRIANTTRCPTPADPGTGRAREEASRYAFLSSHTVLHTAHGRFASLADPPERLREAAAACRNQGAWPVLAGDDDGDRPPGGGTFGHTVLSSPITLYDHPRIAPESPGDLFDGTEIDQLLILSVLSMSEEEQQEMAASDPRGREILERCAALTPDDLMALHGAIRSQRPLEDA